LIEQREVPTGGQLLVRVSERHHAFNRWAGAGVVESFTGVITVTGTKVGQVPVSVQDSNKPAF